MENWGGREGEVEIVKRVFIRLRVYHAFNVVAREARKNCFFFLRITEWNFFSLPSIHRDKMGLFRFDEHSIVEGKKKKKKNVERSTSSIPEAFSFIRRDKDGREISYRSSELQSSWKRWLAIKIGSAYLFVHAAAPISSILRSRLSIPGPFIERRSITVLPRTIPFGTVRISFFRFVPRVERGDKSSANRVRCFSRAFLALFSSLPFFRQFYSTRACHHHRLPPPSSSTPGVSLAWIYIATVRTRIYRETCSNAVLFFQRDPFSLFRPLYGYYAVIYRTVERSTRLAPRIDFNKNIYRILSREVLANRCRLCISSAGRIIRLISLYEYSLYVYIFFFIWNLVFLLVDKTSYVFTMNY